MQELMLGALLVLAIAWLVVRIRQNKAAVIAESMPTAKNGGTFHAVAIKYSENACDAAKAMTGRRFLATAAPHLPLADCNFPECQCTFAHYDDRRTGRDRRSPFAAGGSTGATGTYERERREKTDRRNNDQYDW